MKNSIMCLFGKKRNFRFATSEPCDPTEPRSWEVLARIQFRQLCVGCALNRSLNLHLSSGYAWGPGLVSLVQRA